MSGHPTKPLVEDACQRFLDIGVGWKGEGVVIIRSGSMGAYVASRTEPGRWIPAYWGENEVDKVVDVTGENRITYQKPTPADALRLKALEMLF